MSLLRTSAVLAASRLGYMVVSFVSVRLFIRWLGVESYGVFLLAWTLISYFAITDFGLAYSGMLQVAKVRTDGDEDLLRRTNRALFSGLLAVGVVSGLLVVLCGALLMHFNPKYAVLSAVALVSLGIYVLATHLSKAVNSLQTGYEDYPGISQFALVQSFFTAVFPLAVVWFHRDLSTLFLANSVGCLLGTIVGMGLVVRRTGIDLLRPSLDRAILGPLFKRGLQTVPFSLRVLISGTADKVLVGSFSPALLTGYNNANRVTDSLNSLYRSTYDSSVVAGTNIGQSRPEEIVPKVARYSELLTFGAIVAVAIPSCYGTAILRIWLGPDAPTRGGLLMLIFGWAAVVEMYNLTNGLIASSLGMPGKMIPLSIVYTVLKVGLVLPAYRLGGMVGVAAVNVLVPLSIVVPYHRRSFALAGRAEESGRYLACTFRLLAAGLVATLATFALSEALVQVSPWLALLTLPFAALATLGTIHGLRLAPMPEKFEGLLAKFRSRG